MKNNSIIIFSGIIGHSEGGNIAPVAAGRVSSVKGEFIIAATAFAVDTLFCEQGSQIWGAGEAYWREWIDYSENAGNIVLNLRKPVFIQLGLQEEKFSDIHSAKKYLSVENIAYQSSEISLKTYTNVSYVILDKDSQELAVDVLTDILDRIKEK